MTTVGDVMILVYPAGDCDRVTIVEAGPNNSVVRLPNGKQAVTLNESLVEFGKCAICNGDLAAEPTVTVSCDSPTLSTEECEFVVDPTTGWCENCAWLKVEHELFSEDQEVHNSCYLDHDDILVVS